MTGPKILFLTSIMIFLCGCGKVDYTNPNGSSGPVTIFPDYKDVTIPCNIAPLNYHYATKGVTKAVTTFSCDGKIVRFKGLTIEWNLKKWKKFVSDAVGKTIQVTASVMIDGREVSDTWTIEVSPDKVDSYLTYRLIEPAYQMWDDIEIRERCVEDFSENAICDHQHTGNSCMNCHVHGQQRGDLSIFYIRGAHGGAILNRNGELRKLNLRNEDMISSTVYGELHPSGRFGVFSTNVIMPGIHAASPRRMEVYDSVSDLTVADFDNNRMLNPPHTARKDVFETFPCFSADGNHVYYCAADTVKVPEDVEKLKYSLMRVSFDSATGMLGEQIDTIWSAVEHDASVCHPKASPDGKWLMFTVSAFGTFPLNHRDCTLNMINLETGEINHLDGVKGDMSDTYHSWSSDSRWFVFASKRGDGQYGKPYFCHIDENGKASKPFVLPQRSASFYETFTRSFNIPDLGKESTGLTTRDAKAMYKAESEAFE